MAIARGCWLPLVVVVALGWWLTRGEPAPPRKDQPEVAFGSCRPIEGHFFNAGARHPHFFDAQTGREVAVDLPAADGLTNAACSPWRDDRGRLQLAGRWRSHVDPRASHITEAYGLARYAIPSGRVLDRVVLDIMPVGALCWFPDLPPRVLFNDAGGKLYQYAFEEPEEEARLRPVEWLVPTPGLGALQIDDLNWPSDPRFGRRLFVSLSYQEVVDGRPTFRPPQLWWLQLDPGGTAVVAAGRLSGPGVGDGDGGDSRDVFLYSERFPTPVSTPGGDLVMSFLTRREDALTWQLQMAPIAIDPTSGVPRIAGRSRLTIVGQHKRTPPFVSPDGRWLFGIVGGSSSPARIRRFSIDEAVTTLSMTGPRPPTG